MADRGITLQLNSDNNNIREGTNRVSAFPTPNKNVFSTAADIFSTVTVLGAARTAIELNNQTPPPSQVSFAKKLLAEFLGTYLIVQIGCGVVCSAKYTSAFGETLFPVAMIWGIAVSLAIYTMSPLDSGAHFNPAVTVAMTILRGKAANGMTFLKIIPYILAQVLGAALASLGNYAIFGSSIAAYETSHSIIRGTAASASTIWGAFGEYWSVPSAQVAFGVEALGTAILSFVIFNLTNPRNKKGPPPAAIPALIGMTVTALISVLAPLTQAGFNPARDFGPRLVTAFVGGWGSTISFQGWWVYVFGPIFGALVGGFVAEKIVWGCSTS
jgi:glycerol uptake facilitator protein